MEYFLRVGARLLQLLGTLVLTRFIAPDAYGAVLTASIAVITAGISTSFAFGQYLIAHQSNGKWPFRRWWYTLCSASLPWPPSYPYAGRFRVGLAMWPLRNSFQDSQSPHILDRLRYVPERVLTRELRFRVIAMINGAAEIFFTVVSLVLVRNYGATAIMIATIARAAFSHCLFFIVTPLEQWFVVSPARSRRPFVPCWLRRANHADRHFGPRRLAARQHHSGEILRPRRDGLLQTCRIALPEMPVTNIAGNIAEVLMPSYSKMPDRDRASAVVKSAALMTLVVAPLGVGLAAVAPTVVAASSTTSGHSWRRC